MSDFLDSVYANSNPLQGSSKKKNKKKKSGGSGGGGSGGSGQKSTITQNSPLGSQVTTIKSGKSGTTVTEDLNLTPEQQKLLKKEQKLSGGALDATSALGKSLYGLAQTPAPEANDEARQRVEDALYGRATSRLDPQFEDAERALEDKLINQGFSRGSEGYDNALEKFGRTKTDAYNTALFDAIYGGGQEQSRLLNMELASRAVPFNELGTFAALGTGATLPQFSTAGTGIAGQSTLLDQQNRANQKIANKEAKTSLWDSIFDAGGTILGGYLGGL